MKEGPIGRGRGTPDAARQQLAAMEIAEQATRAPMTPEEARRNRRVVSAGQTSPDRPELDIDALLEAKRRRSPCACGHRGASVRELAAQNADRVRPWTASRRHIPLKNAMR
jgi:hypothetical protein